MSLTLARRVSSQRDIHVIVHWIWDDLWKRFENQRKSIIDLIYCKVTRKKD